MTIKNVETQGNSIGYFFLEETKQTEEFRLLGFSFRFLGSRAVSVLNHWFQSNRDYPYPDDERTDRLAREAGLFEINLSLDIVAQ